MPVRSSVSGTSGSITTRDVDELVALRADAMSWHGLTYEPATFAKFLRAGTSVYSSMGGWYLPGEAEFDELEAAAEEGDATLLSGGNIPGLISDVLPLFISGYSSRVRMIRAWQSDYVPNVPLRRSAAGWVSVSECPPRNRRSSPRWTTNGPGASVSPPSWWPPDSGLPFDELRITDKEFGMATEDLLLAPSGLEIKAGTPAGVKWTFTAYSEGQPFFELVNEQTAQLGLGDRMALK